MIYMKSYWRMKYCFDLPYIYILFLNLLNPLWKDSSPWSRDIKESKCFKDCALLFLFHFPWDFFFSPSAWLNEWMNEFVKTQTKSLVRGWSSEGGFPMRKIRQAVRRIDKSFYIIYQPIYLLNSFPRTQWTIRFSSLKFVKRGFQRARKVGWKLKTFVGILVITSLDVILSTKRTLYSH